MCLFWSSICLPNLWGSKNIYELYIIISLSIYFFQTRSKLLSDLFSLLNLPLLLLFLIYLNCLKDFLNKVLIICFIFHFKYTLHIHMYKLKWLENIENNIIWNYFYVTNAWIHQNKYSMIFSYLVMTYLIMAGPLGLYYNYTYFFCKTRRLFGNLIRGEYNIIMVEVKLRVN